MKDTKIHIQNPCPMALSRMKKDTGFYCSSCSKTLLDFRDKTNDEIKVSITPETCGIYNTEQVSTPTFSFSYKLAFKVLTILSFIGFQVKPLYAQDTVSKPKTIDSLHQLPSQTGIIVSPTFPNKNRKEPEINQEKLKQKKYWFRRKKKQTLLGSPSF